MLLYHSERRRRTTRNYTHSRRRRHASGSENTLNERRTGQRDRARSHREERLGGKVSWRAEVGRGHRTVRQRRYLDVAVHADRSGSDRTRSGLLRRESRRQGGGGSPAGLGATHASQPATTSTKRSNRVWSPPMKISPACCIELRQLCFAFSPASYADYAAHLRRFKQEKVFWARSRAIARICCQAGELRSANPVATIAVSSSNRCGRNLLFLRAGYVNLTPYSGLQASVVAETLARESSSSQVAREEFSPMATGV